LATRDVVSRAIFTHKKETNKGVYLDFSMFKRDWFRERFPNITKTFHSLGYRLPEDRVPISPAFHYAIGGIKSDLDGKVEGIENLYVVGEAGNTGVHGANRLASNSLLEGVVFAKRAVSHILGKKSSKFKKPIFDKEAIRRLYTMARIESIREDLER